MSTYLQQWADKRNNKIQFPKEVSCEITLYVRYTDILTGNQINVRCVLRNCFYNSDSISVFKNTGQQAINNVTVYIPYRSEVTGRIYITPEEWNNLGNNELEKYWTADPRNLPIIVNGIQEHEFEWQSPNAPTGTLPPRITIQETNFLVANPTARRIVDINPQLFGDLDMQHIVIRG